MKLPLPPILGLSLITLLTPALADTNLLPNPSFETATEERPKGWRVFLTPPETAGDFYVTSGQEGQDTRTGARALQFHFPTETTLAQGVWMADPTHGGIAVEPGRYSCSFWIKGTELPDKTHTWISITGYKEDNSRASELGRSSYLTNKDLTPGEWTQVRFSFEVFPDSKITRIAPAFVVKTHPNSSPNPVPASTRISLDDLVVQKD